MTDKNNDKQRPDALAVAGKAAKVKTNRAKFILNRELLLLGVIVLLILGVMLTGGHHQKPDKADQRNENMQHSLQDYHAALAANLEKLKSLQTNIKNVVVTEQVNNQPDKEYLARQNAPNGMFSGEAVVNSNTKARENKSFIGNNVFSSFGNKNSAVRTVTASTIAHPEYSIVSGEFIHATLETAIHSDLPGMIRAVVTAPVYSYVGSKTMIPIGSRLIGQYSSSVLQGQNRVFAMWNRIVLPSGVTINIDSPNIDYIGRAGQTAGTVASHFLERFSEAALLSLIGAGAANYDIDDNTQYNSAALYRAAISQSFGETANQSLHSTVPMKPSLKINQGAKINVFVAHDLDFYTVREKL